MLQTITESLNGERTTQTFCQGATYPVPDQVGQLWIARGWAEAAQPPRAGLSSQPSVHSPRRKE
jgi:hypothetical protein